MSTDKKIVIAIWNSKSNWRAKTHLPFLHPMKLKDERSGLHAALLLYRPTPDSTRDYPFHKDMPCSALPEYEVLSMFQNKEIKCSDARGDTPLNHPDIVSFDSYINFLPEDQSVKSDGGIINGLKSMPHARRTSQFEDGQFILSGASDPYEEAVAEYFEYRHGRKEERLPDIHISIPVKSDTQDGLDYEKIQAWWAMINRSRTLKYQYLSQNCSYAVLQALKAGGAENFLPFHSLFPVTPKKVGRYTDNINKGKKTNVHSGAYTLENIIIYIIELIKRIQHLTKAKKTTLMPKFAIREDLSINDLCALLKLRTDSSKNNELMAIIKVLKMYNNSKFPDVKVSLLKEAESKIADYLFFHPSTKDFNILSSIMVGIEKFQNSHLELWYEDSRLNSLAIKLKVYSESSSKKYGLLDRSKKRSIITEFFDKNPNTADISLSSWIGLKEKLDTIDKNGESNKFINAIIMEFDTLDSIKSASPSL